LAGIVWIFGARGIRDIFLRFDGRELCSNTADGTDPVDEKNIDMVAQFCYHLMGLDRGLLSVKLRTEVIEPSG